MAINITYDHPRRHYSLQDTTLYAENLGTTKLYHYTWKLIIGIETSSIDQRFQQIRESCDKADGLCTGCAEEFELKALRRRVYRLEELITTLCYVRKRYGVLFQNNF